jgi:hypothetical protein
MPRRKPSWVDPNPDPRDQAGTSYNNHIWYNKQGKVLGRSEQEDAPLTRLSGKHNKHQISKRDRSSYNVNPDWLNIHHQPPSGGSGPISSLRRKAIMKMKADGKLSKRQN